MRCALSRLNVKYRLPQAFSGLLVWTVLLPPFLVSHRQLISDAVWYGSSYVVRYLVAFALLPIYTRAVSQDEFGRLEVILSATALLSFLANLQLATSVNRFYHQHVTEGTKKAFIGGSLVFRAATSIVAACFFILYVGTWGPPWLRSNISLGTWAWAAFSTSAALINDLFFQFLRLMERRSDVVLLSTLSVLLSGGLSMFLLLSCHWGITGVVVGQSLANGIIALELARRFKGVVEFRVIPPGLEALMKYALPLVPSLLLGWCWTYLMRIFVYRQLEPATTAILGIAMKTLIVFDLVGTAFRLAWEPLAMKVLHFEQRGSGTWYAVSLNMLACGLLLVTTGLCVGGQLLLRLLAPPEYGPAAALIPFLAAATCIGYGASVLNLGNQIKCRTAWWTLSQALAIAIYFSFAYLCLPSLGIKAVAIGMLIGTLMQFLVVYFTAQRSHYIRYDAVCLVTLCLLPSLMSAVTFVWPGRYLTVISSLLTSAIVVAVLGYRANVTLPKRTNMTI